MTAEEAKIILDDIKLQEVRYTTIPPTIVEPPKCNGSDNKKTSKEPIRHHWMYWRHLDSKFFSLSYIQNVVECRGNFLIEMSDHEFYTQYPQRILASDIFILDVFNKS